jgi:hypothetical protein
MCGGVSEVTEGTEPPAGSSKPLTRADVERIVKEARNGRGRPDLRDADLTDPDLSLADLRGGA